MDIEAILIFVAIFVAAVITLAIPFVWLGRKAHSLPETAAGSMRVTRAGVIFAIIYIPLLTLAFGIKYIVPDISHSIRALAIVSVIIIGFLGDHLANKLGFGFLKKNNKENA